MMGEVWVCKQHSDASFVMVCEHLGQSVEDGRPLTFGVISEEYSPSLKAYLSIYVCATCLTRLNLPGPAVTFFDPQIRRMEIDEGFAPQTLQYEEIIDPSLCPTTAVCRQCLEEVYPDFKQQGDALFAQAKELPRRIMH